ncbi:hypothetical protein SAMN04488595_101248 [Ralstonia sp. 25mfcol4.1]|uniref:hypothetical protein n=1 Tax=Ralstonia sp. 25mfcol4.1 TaxID=1761899 RepID=UPI0008839FF5|nr:hypothetical protein [Ralstonia sp. 25mfcol4.1]SDO62021.1 hypothetical protein SAMN04488595_101248 [Ralstonia sp. 25mfcol4.1]
MQTYPRLSDTQHACRAACENLLSTCDRLYADLPNDCDADAADGIDRQLEKGEATVWRRIEYAGQGVRVLETIATHLRNGADIQHAEHEPTVADAARLLRAARMAGVVAQDKVDQTAIEIETAARNSLGRLARISVEIKGLCLALDIAKANQRLSWLRRVAANDPNEDMRDVIRDSEKRVAAAKLAYATREKV